MIEADDCVCALLTPEGYAEERHKCAGTYYATPYFSKDFGLDRFYNKFCDQLGEELLNELGFDWFMQKMFDGYSRCLYINTGIEDRSTCEENAKKFASYFGWNYETRHGTLKMIEDALAKTKELASIQWLLDPHVIRIFFSRTLIHPYMKLFLDEHFTGSKEYYEALGWEVTTVQDEGMKGKKDREIAEYAKEKGYILITRDELPYNISQLIGGKCFRVTEAMIAGMISNNVKALYGQD